ncbi:MAG: glutamate synthase large subunit, partial [Neisseriaceae bacterium]
MLYRPELIKENCGFGLIANLEGKASHKVIRTAILGLSRMQHRGAILSDGKTGDGCGLLMQMPKQFFKLIAKELHSELTEHFAVGMIFFPRNEALTQRFSQIVEQELLEEMLTVKGWREVPINASVLGKIAASSLPTIKQIFVTAPAGWKTKDMERRLFMCRRRIEKKIQDEDFYICSLSTEVVVYKGLCMPVDLPKFYLDLADLRMQSAICLFHQRFSTNTSPQWKLAQPFRYLAHNGEINTISGNRAWARARAYKYKTPLIPDLADARPFVNETGSDSSSLDNMFEVFLTGGMDLFRAMRLLIPPAWQHDPDMDEDLKAFYNFNSMHMEPWDGPAGVVFCDGRYAACTLDRNGLRPARFVITTDQLITIASEIGIWDYAPDEVLSKGSVGAGELLVIDTKMGRLLTSGEIDHIIKNRHPYRQWLSRNVLTLKSFEQMAESEGVSPSLPRELLTRYQKIFEYNFEELEYVLKPLGENAQEAVGSMGDDTPLAILSEKPRILYDYFRQYFAQVTNPPIDPLREAHVMSLVTNIGREMSVFYETEGMSHRLNIYSPILLFSDIQQLLQLPSEHYQLKILDATYDIRYENLKSRLEALVLEAEQATQSGTVVLVISDKGVDENRAPIPAALSVGIIQTSLVKNDLRCDVNIIVETGSARDSHQFAVLLSLGATAIYPYLAYESLAHMVCTKAIQKPIKQVLLNYRNGINKGLCKIISKMGISTIASYRCAGLFEIVGLAREVVDVCFQGMTTRISGLGFEDLNEEIVEKHTRAWRTNQPLPSGGFLRYQPQGEVHAYHPEVVNQLRKATDSGDFEDYKVYCNLVNSRKPLCIRDLLKLKLNGVKPIPLEEVEPATELYPRFDSAAMSIGALSPEAHEAIAIAMNRLGGFSNSGEGGEDPKRYRTEKVSKIKQLASGRFGVTPAYLMNARVIQIKIAQGAKPGEGGQLPGGKVTPYIAHLRYAVPGSTLISPPPHHDIYSIEDLAQLIFDLKQLNPKAWVSVKLVSSPGVGTIASGVVKAYADLITISGYDGGTGASPLTSVKHAGSAWELGLAEVQQTLVANALRCKVRLQVDGGLKTGLDVVKAAILGAESFGFGTGPMIALGCRYLRICHLNNCATGVATQDDTLREKHFHGLPEKVMNYFKFL